MKVPGAVRVAASRSMILLDPDLDSHPTKGATALESLHSERKGRMPSARALGRFLGEAQMAVRLTGAVSVLLTTDAGIKRLNRRFRGKNKATDVLSFPAASSPASQKVNESASHRNGGPAGERVCGDLAISVDTARRQAAEQGHALAAELKVLMLHGLLHLAGYDHETDDGHMARRERALRGKLGLPLGLIERASAGEGRASSRYPTLAANHSSDEDLSPGAPAESRRKHGAPGIRAADKTRGAGAAGLGKARRA